jgi:hypothetical protein
LFFLSFFLFVFPSESELRGLVAGKLNGPARRSGGKGDRSGGGEPAGAVSDG